MAFVDTSQMFTSLLFHPFLINYATNKAWRLHGLIVIDGNIP